MQLNPLETNLQMAAGTLSLAAVARLLGGACASGTPRPALWPVAAPRQVSAQVAGRGCLGRGCRRAAQRQRLSVKPLVPVRAGKRGTMAAEDLLQGSYRASMRQMHEAGKWYHWDCQQRSWQWPCSAVADVSECFIC